MAPPDPVASFIARWTKAETAERANYVLFLTELCDLLGVPRPDPAGPDTAQNAYVFERAVMFHHAGGKTSSGRIDLYKRSAFVCECKQYANVALETAELALAQATDSAPAKKGKIARGSEAWDRAMFEAHGQADRYARSLPTDEDPPPFLLVVDVGHVFELYADFSQKGKACLPFPRRPRPSHPARRSRPRGGPRQAPRRLARPALPRPGEQMLQEKYRAIAM